MIIPIQLRGSINDGKSPVRGSRALTGMTDVAVMSYRTQQHKRVAGGPQERKHNLYLCSQIRFTWSNKLVKLASDKWRNVRFKILTMEWNAARSKST